VSLDSVAAYSELNIGSSKPLGKDFTDFQWCGIGIVSPETKMNASLMKKAILPFLEIFCFYVKKHFIVTYIH
jgi:tRNA A37 N6-isopentenylltransferase MiaA